MEWKDIIGFDGLYRINDSGDILSVRKQKYLSQGKTEYGYAYVVLYKNNVGSAFKVSRLVAKYFVENPNNYREVNHKDGNKLNNTSENLEWCTRSHNTKHAWDLGLNKGNTKKILNALSELDSFHRNKV